MIALRIKLSTSRLSAEDELSAPDYLVVFSSRLGGARILDFGASNRRYTVLATSRFVVLLGFTLSYDVKNPNVRL